MRSLGMPGNTRYIFAFIENKPMYPWVKRPETLEQLRGGVVGTQPGNKVTEMVLTGSHIV